MTGQELKAKLMEVGKTQKDIADLMGVTAQSLSSVLSAKDVKSGTIEKIANAAGVPVSYLYKETDDTSNGSHSSQAVGDGATATNSEGVKECLEIIRKQQESIDKLVDAIAALSHSTSRTSRT